jgi:hypothetical protein
MPPVTDSPGESSYCPTKTWKPTTNSPWKSPRFELADAAERQLDFSYANIQWRINRAAAIEDTMFTPGIMEEVAENLNIENAEAHNATSNVKTFRSDARAFDRISMYNQHLVNALLHGG